MRIIIFFRHIFLLSQFFIRAFFIRLCIRDPILLRKKRLANTTFIAKKFMKAFQISVTLKNPQHLEKLRDEAYLLVANHISYTDIIILAALENYSFISSVEMGKNPLLGSITRQGGSLYTNRKNPVGLKQEIENFANAIKNGFKVVLFPEGTSTDARTVQPFKKSLFQIAFSASCPVLPLCIKYKSVDGKALDDANRDLVAWYGDMTFVPHFLGLLNRPLSVEIQILESIPAERYKTRAELSDAVFEQIQAAYHADEEIA